MESDLCGWFAQDTTDEARPRQWPGVYGCYGWGDGCAECRRSFSLWCRAADSAPSLRRRRSLSIAIRRASSRLRSEEHTSELQSLMRISYAVLCLKKKKR